MEKTVGTRGSALRPAICWKAEIMAAAATTGSFNLCGRAACPPCPRTVMRTSSLEAMYFPARKPTVPVGSSGSTCSPITAATSNSAKGSSFSTSEAPPGLTSSPGWNNPSTVPSKRSLRSRSNNSAPSRAAACMSCPQACITPSLTDANGSPVRSETGSASMSARSTTVRFEEV